jgi:hypothetical protein
LDAVAPPADSTAKANGALALFLAAAPAALFQELRQEVKRRRKESGVFTARLVVWLMIQQFIDSKGSLSSAVQGVLEGHPATLLPSHKRLTNGTLSSHTGAYCKARKRLPMRVVKQVSDNLFQYLMADQPEALPGLGLKAYLYDGSSILAPASEELLKAYPAATNQYGSSHFPTLRVVVAHDLVSGIAMRPRWGPMYGKQAASEQQLAVDSLDDLTAGSVVVWDCNFGIFYTTYEAHCKQHPVVTRLTNSRARSLLKGKLPQECDLQIDWTPSVWDSRQHRDLPAAARVTGRLIGCQVLNSKGKVTQLYLFTTLNLPVSQILQLYGYRWNIELDLRSLKQTVNLHMLSCRSVEMVAKELILAVAAYNLVRATMLAAAHTAGIDPRQLSFSQVQDVVRATLPALTSATSEAEAQRVVDRILKRAAQCRLPKRRSRRSYPRVVWGRHQAFPTRRK